MTFLRACLSPFPLPPQFHSPGSILLYLVARRGSGCTCKLAAHDTSLIGGSKLAPFTENVSCNNRLLLFFPAQFTHSSRFTNIQINGTLKQPQTICILWRRGKCLHPAEISKELKWKIERCMNKPYFSKCNSQVCTGLEIFNHKYPVIRPWICINWYTVITDYHSDP